MNLILVLGHYPRYWPTRIGSLSMFDSTLDGEVVCRYLSTIVEFAGDSRSGCFRAEIGKMLSICQICIAASFCGVESRAGLADASSTLASVRRNIRSGRARILQLFQIEPRRRYSSVLADAHRVTGRVAAMSLLVMAAWVLHRAGPAGPVTATAARTAGGGRVEVAP